MKFGTIKYANTVIRLFGHRTILILSLTYVVVGRKHTTHTVYDYYTSSFTFILIILCDKFIFYQITLHNRFVIYLKYCNLIKKNTHIKTVLYHIESRKNAKENICVYSL